MPTLRASPDTLGRSTPGRAHSRNKELAPITGLGKRPEWYGLKVEREGASDLSENCDCKKENHEEQEARRKSLSDRCVREKQWKQRDWPEATVVIRWVKIRVSGLGERFKAGDKS